MYDIWDGKVLDGLVMICSQYYGIGLALLLACTVEKSRPLNFHIVLCILSIGRNFITRGLIKVKMADIQSFLNQFTCSSGFSYNVGTLDGQKVMNFEVSSRGVVATEIKGYNYHFNM